MYRILALDDSNVIRSLIKVTLDFAPVHVDPFGSASLAQLALQQENYQMLIVDYMMPDTNGIDFIRQARALPQYKNTPIIMLTADGTDEVKQQARDLKVTAWVRKPFQPQSLIKLTNELLLKHYPKFDSKDRTSLRQQHRP